MILLIIKQNSLKMFYLSSFQGQFPVPQFLFAIDWLSLHVNNRFPGAKTAVLHLYPAQPNVTLSYDKGSQRNVWWMNGLIGHTQVVVQTKTPVKKIKTLPSLFIQAHRVVLFSTGTSTAEMTVFEFLASVPFTVKLSAALSSSSSLNAQPGSQ